MFSRIKGTQDILDKSLLQSVLQKIFTHIKHHNFQEIDTPIVESTQLFQRGLGYETDVVSKQMFTIESKSSSEQICLRPEATAGTMRAFVENQGKLLLPWKVFSYGPMFRYERPQKGRLRQFHQVNIEAIGIETVEYDALFISMLSQMFETVLGIDTFVLNINFLGQPEDREKFKQVLHDFLMQHDDVLCETCKKRRETNILRVFDCKSETCQNLYAQAPKLTDHLSDASLQEWQLVKKLLHQLSVTYVENPYLVRGLDYYNKTVFEFVGTTLGAQNAFCGGGRYDGLAQQLGSKNMVPALGAAIGVERLLLLLEGREHEFVVEQKSLVCVVPCEQTENELALMLVDHLQAAGVCVDILLDQASLKSRLRKANKLQASYAVIVGQEEREQNFVTVKNMITGEDQKVSQAELTSFFKD